MWWTRKSGWRVEGTWLLCSPVLLSPSRLPSWERSQQHPTPATQTAQTSGERSAFWWNTVVFRLVQLTYLFEYHWSVLFTSDIKFLFREYFFAECSTQLKFAMLRDSVIKFLTLFWDTPTIDRTTLRRTTLRWMTLRRTTQSRTTLVWMQHYAEWGIMPSGITPNAT